MATDPETYEKMERFIEYAEEHPEEAEALILEGAEELSNEMQDELLRGINKYALYEDQKRYYDLNVAGTQDAFQVGNPAKKLLGGTAIGIAIIKKIPDESLGPDKTPDVDLPKKQQPWKHENRADVSHRTADDVNSGFVQDGWQPPYKSGTKVTEYTTKADDQFVRVHFEKNQEGTWLMKKEAIEGLSPEQIQRKYSLKHKPSLVSDVKVSEGTRIRTGKVKGNFELRGGGGKGATQYEVIDDDWAGKLEFSNPRPIGK